MCNCAFSTTINAMCALLRFAIYKTQLYQLKHLNSGPKLRNSIVKRIRTLLSNALYISIHYTNIHDIYLRIRCLSFLINRCDVICRMDVNGKRLGLRAILKSKIHFSCDWNRAFIVAFGNIDFFLFGH